jgi:hypothetical protein
MKILIIGGGWVGCHLYQKLISNHSVFLIDKNKELFSESSFFNQNRLHIGFHYPRNYKTRNLCKNTFDRFINDYSNFVSKVQNNIYCIPKFDSIIDYETYIDIFRDFDFEKFDVHEITNVEGCIKVNEQYINNFKLKNFFNSNIKFITQEINQNDILEFSKKYDLVINCTNNQINDLKNDSFYELTISLVYRKINTTSFDSITLVDGDLYSIYPYGDNLFTLTDVKLTPIKKFNSFNDLKQFKNNLNEKFIKKYIKKFESRVNKFFPNFKQFFEYDSYFTSVKSKKYDNSDNRYPIINKNNNVINCFTGKIQGIYIIEDYILNEIKKYESINR